MNKQSPINDLLQKRMDRKDFIKHVGIGFVMMTGLAGVVKLLKPQQQSSGSTYGSSAYGGARTSRPSV